MANNPRQRNSRRRPTLAEHPRKQRNRHACAQQKSFIRTAVGEDEQSGCHDYRIPPALMMFDPWQSAEHKRSSQRGQARAPIAVRPVTQKSETSYNQHAAEQRPARRNPALQHPANRPAHHCRGKQLPDPRISQNLPQRQHQPLRPGDTSTYTSAGQITWKVSKCIHIGCGGLVNRPCAKVSAASK